MEKYIALLRGVNISGKNKISMLELKNEFIELGYSGVVTYLNSGNVIFMSNVNNIYDITSNIHEMIKNKFNIDIPIFVISYHELKELFDNRPSWWGSNDKSIYDNIIFVISPHTCGKICDVLGDINDKLEKIMIYKNNIFWSYDLNNYRKTNWWSRTASTSIRDYITIRTANTVRKILEICEVE